MNYRNFFETHLVFSLAEFRETFSETKANAANNILKYYVKQEKLRSVKRGVYYIVPEGSNPETFQPNPILVTSRLSPDAVVAFHTAFEVMGYGHSIFHQFYYYTALRKKPVSFRDNEFISVSIPKKLQQSHRALLSVKKESFQNLSIACTNRERTLVDCLDRPSYAGGTEEVYRCLEKYPYINFEEVLKYLDVLEKPVLYAKVGFFLEQHRKQFFVENNLLQLIKNKIPSSIVYFDSKRKTGQLVKDWNLIVPEIVLKKGWEEF